MIGKPFRYCPDNWVLCYQLVVPSFFHRKNSMTETIPFAHEKNSLTIQQWMMLVFSFLLGIAAVLTVDKLFIADSMPTGSVQAAVSHP
jgi:hypothetical protein